MNRIYTIIILVISIMFSMACITSAQEAILDNCNVYFDKTGVCPKEACNYGCLGGIYFEGCEVGCGPKPCIDIEAEHCPLDTCQLVLGCEGKDVCFSKSDLPPPTCGDLAYGGDEVACCEGMMKRCGVEFFDGTCDMAGRYSVYSIPICIPCGNGVCNQFENACNCPEDCKKDYTDMDKYKGLDLDAIRQERLESMEVEVSEEVTEEDN